MVLVLPSRFIRSLRLTVLLMGFTTGALAVAEEIYPGSGSGNRSPASLSTTTLNKDACGLKSKRLNRHTDSDGANEVYRALATENGIHGFELDQNQAGPTRAKILNGDEIEGESVSPSVTWKFHLTESSSPLSITEWPVRIEKDADGGLDEVFAAAEGTSKEYFFFPRKMASTIKKSGSVLYVTLPNGEHVELNAKSKRIIGGVFTERARPNAGVRAAAGYELAFPTSEIVYTGKGVWIEVLGNQAVIRTNSPDPACKAGAVCTECRISAEDLWKEDSKCHLLAFATDAEFNDVLKERCQFSLTKPW